jgi:hypothetical protein
VDTPTDVTVTTLHGVLVVPEELVVVTGALVIQEQTLGTFVE